MMMLTPAQTRMLDMVYHKPKLNRSQLSKELGLKSASGSVRLDILFLKDLGLIYDLYEESRTRTSYVISEKGYKVLHMMEQIESLLTDDDD